MILTTLFTAPLLLAGSSPLPIVAPSSQAGTEGAEAVQIRRLTVPVSRLDFGEKSPSWSQSMWLSVQGSAALLPRVVIPGWHATIELPTLDGSMLAYSELREGSLALSADASTGTAGGPVTGILYLPDAATREQVAYPFVIPAGAAEKSDLRWREIEASRYRALESSGIPGTAWFRRRADSLAPVVVAEEDDQRRSRRRMRHVAETFAMFTGGRALAENLALDDVLRESRDGSTKLIDIAELEGVEVPELDFGPLVEGIDIELDPLSRAVPHDQYAVFFPSFAALLRVADQVDDDTRPLVQLFDGRSQHAHVRERYETQMCLSLGGLARTFGSQFVESVAITGSDTYLRTGSDVAVLFQGSTTAIRGMLMARIEAAAKDFGVEVQSRDVDGVPVVSAVTPDRVLSVHLAVGDGFVVVSNSPVQVTQVLKAGRDAITSLDDLPEYKWFRNRYPLNGPMDEGLEGEDALAVVSDAAIRRWASARWRIGASRRLKAAALLADADAWRLGYRMGVSAADESRSDLAVRGGGTISYDSGFATEGTYGRLNFLTPIAELDIQEVTESERDGYTQWRQNYERAWTTSFDPIAVSLDVTDDKLSVDMTLVPLVVRTDYRELIDIAGAVKLKPGVGDFHEEAILHWVSALDTKSRMYRSLTSFVGGMGNDRFSLDWVGEHVAVYVDRDEEYLRRVEESDSSEVFSEELLPGLPIGIEVGVKSPFKLAAFLTGLRGFVEDAVPGMFDYETREHEGRKYVAIVPADGGFFPSTPSIFYVALQNAWVVSFSENVIRGAVGRSVARQAAASEPAIDGAHDPEPAPWTGASTGLHVGSGIQEAFAVELFELAARHEMRSRSWANLAILNEWKAAGAADPVAFHREEWGIELICAGGGTYVWNEEQQTMESTVFGHPGAPEDGPLLPPALERLKSLAGSLDFEEVGADRSRGLRARIELKH